MHVYAGLFLVAFASLAIEITLVRLLSVTTWYHLAYFAISTAMLGMTAGATRVYLAPDAFTKEKFQAGVASSCNMLALSVPVSTTALCLIPLSLYGSVMSLAALLAVTAACSLPFYFAGIVVSAVLTKSLLPIGRLYAADLFGASLGCLFVLVGLNFLDACSLLLFAGALCAGSGALFAWRAPTSAARTSSLFLAGLLALATGFNAASPKGIRPVVVKGNEIEPATTYLYEFWNSFSRVAVYPKKIVPPVYWGASPKAPTAPIEQYEMNIDGDAGTTARRFHSLEDIEHLRYDVVNVPYFLGRKGPACVIGVGGGRDVQSALLFGHEKVVGIELNPIFIEIQKKELRDFTRLADRPDVDLRVAEARSHLAQSTEQFAVIQMSLIDTWAATGAGAFSLSENSLYTLEAWDVFLQRLAPGGVFTVSRWHNEARLGETGRAMALAVGALLRRGVKEPSRHIALVTRDVISTLIVARDPLSEADVARLKEVCADKDYNFSVVPGVPPANPELKAILAATSLEQLTAATDAMDLNCAPPTDENPYFFNMLRLNRLGALHGLTDFNGVLVGNLIATLTLLGLLFALLLLAVGTIVVPLDLRRNLPGPKPPPVLWTGALYFALIGAGFMLTEIAMIQKLTILLSHPTYALGVLLFTIIASTGLGSFLSDRLPLDKQPFIYLFPLATAGSILVERWALDGVVGTLASSSMPVKAAAAIAVVAPMGVLMGLFFPAGMRLAAAASPGDAPWYWAINGVFGVLFSTIAVLISIYSGISTNFYLAAGMYAATLIGLEGMRRAAVQRSAAPPPAEAEPAPAEPAPAA